MLAVQGACPHGGSPGVHALGAVCQHCFACLHQNEKSHSTFVEWLLELLNSKLAYASVKLESVTDTEVVAGGGLRGEGASGVVVEGGAADRQSSTVLVADASDRCVQS